MFASDKYSNLLRKFVTYSRIKFYNICYRSFDSGLPMSPEVRRRLKAISQRSPSELSLLERKRSSLTSALTRYKCY